MVPHWWPVVMPARHTLRAWCEAFVEQELLQSVTQRYRHNIMMTKLPKIDATRLGAATAAIEPLFARACDRMTGHSHAAEKMSTKPTTSPSFKKIGRRPKPLGVPTWQTDHCGCSPLLTGKRPGRRASLLLRAVNSLVTCAAHSPRPERCHLPGNRQVD